MNEKEAAEEINKIGYENFRRETTGTFAPRPSELPEIIADPNCPEDKIFLTPSAAAFARAVLDGEDTRQLFGTIKITDIEIISHRKSDADSPPDAS